MTRIKLVTMLLLALIMATALGLSSDQTNNGAENERDAKVGGWQRLPVENVNAYKEVLTFLRNKEMVLHKGYRIFGVYRQIVAGVNYKFIVHMENEYR